MDVQNLVATYPRLWHMAHDGAWTAIREQGLLSVEAILDLYGVVGADRKRLFEQRRPVSLPVAARGLPGAVLRDQKPMSDGALLKCLVGGMTPSDWYRHLNGKTYLWLSNDRIWKLLRARAYRNLPQTVLTIDTAAFVAAYEPRIWLSPMNSGSTLYSPLERGPDTFKRIADFPFAERAKTRKPDGNVIELLVDHSIPDVADFVLAVHRVCDDEVLEEIWRSPDADDGDRP